MSRKSKISLPCCRICFPDSEYITFIKTHLILSKIEPLKVLIKIHRAENGPLEKLGFSMPCCSILLTDSEYITLFETPSILSELEPIKVW